jgi:hypothetical protein
VGSGVPHCGHLFPSGMGWFIFTVSMPTSEAKLEECYRKRLCSRSLCAGKAASRGIGQYLFSLLLNRLGYG